MTPLARAILTTPFGELMAAEDAGEEHPAIAAAIAEEGRIMAHARLINCEKLQNRFLVANGF